MSDLFDDIDADRDAIRQFVAEERNPLRREFEAARAAIDYRQFEILRGIGFPAARLIEIGAIGTTTAVIDHRDYWQPAEEGCAVIITPLLENNRTIDLIAIDPHDLDAWYLRTGAGWALGMAAIERATSPWDDRRDRLLLHPTPADMLKCGGEGACVVRWNDEARATLRRAHAIDVSSPIVAQQLRLELSRPPRLPEIDVKRWRRDAA